jgi:hypothetical protein
MQKDIDNCKTNIKIKRKGDGMFKIEKGIPLPESKYPFAEMEVGDSFFVPCESKEARRVQAIIINCKLQTTI